MNNYIIEDENLSIAWAKALLLTISESQHEISPLIIKIINLSNTEPKEENRIRILLDNILSQLGKPSIETVAGTIFPKSLWNKKQKREVLYQLYEKAFSSIYDSKNNKDGTYFQRLIMYEKNIDIQNKKNKRKLTLNNNINQLEHIINTWTLKGNHRRSALQASIFDPRQDHTNKRQKGFPCLQQIGFNFKGSNGSDGLIISGLYPQQHLLEKAYGNYLGLCRLGHFMANEMGIEINEMICFINRAKFWGENDSYKEIMALMKSQLENILKD